MLYLDYSANTPVDEEVLRCFCEAERRYPGNANAHHQAGSAAKAAINEATRSIARCLGAPPAGIIYTSGASEANNLAVKGLAALGGAAGRHILSTPLEHSSVSGSLEALQKQGYEVELLDILPDGTAAPGHRSGCCDRCGQRVGCSTAHCRDCRAFKGIPQLPFPCGRHAGCGENSCAV